MNSSSFSARKVAFVAILTALIVVLQAALGSIQIGAVQLNFSLIPIVLGAVMFGPMVGAALGLVSGVIVLIQVIMGLSPFYLIIWEHSPLITTTICLFKTTVAGFVSGWAYALVKKKNAHVAIFVASGIVPIINTALFIIGCLCMSNTVLTFKDSLISAMPEVAGMNAFIFVIIVLVTFNFFVELAINILLSPALYKVIRVIDKSIIGEYEQDGLKDDNSAEENISVIENKTDGKE